jgi:chromosome segregation ATPase
MFSDSELKRIEDSITKLRADIQKLQHDGAEIRDRELRAIKRIQSEAERAFAMNERHQRDAEREIQRHEQDLQHRRAELERKFSGGQKH